MTVMMDPHFGQTVVLTGGVDLEVVGESYYQANLRTISGDRPGRFRLEIKAVLHPELDNHYDPNAISVWVNGLEVGHLPREEAQRYRPGLLELQQRHAAAIGLAGVVVGEEIRGVFLRHNPLEFGIATAPVPFPHDGRLRTGLSDALATDAIDNSYDLSWLGTLPYDSAAAIARLRELLRDEHDPIDRHFMLHELEAGLYRARNAMSSALTEFDEVCSQHDGEMEALRAAFMAKWSVVPWLQTYRQMCIREQKAGNFQAALWWAERGITIYANDAARPEALADLTERASEYRARLAAPLRVIEPRPAAPTTFKNQAPASVKELLRCIECGQPFERTRTRGRKPSRCPACRNGAVTESR